MGGLNVKEQKTICDGNIKEKPSSFYEDSITLVPTSNTIFKRK